MVGPEILFSIYQCCFLAGFCAKWLHKAGSSPTNLTSARLGRPAGPEVAPPSMFNGCNCIEVCNVVSGISSAASRYYCKGHFCDQFFTKFDDTEYVYQCMIGTPSEAE